MKRTETKSIKVGNVTIGGQNWMSNNSCFN